VAAKVVNSILVAIGRQAPTYDPQSMDAVEWIGRCAEAEAKKLLAMLHSGGKIARRTRRAM